jgi:tRNA/rRNA methyltransferase
VSELDQLRVVLVASRNPLNIGAAARAMSNFGCAHLRVVNPYEPAFREARSAVGASELLASAEIYANVAEAVSDCTLVVGTTAVRHRVLQQPLHRLEYGGRLIRRHLASSGVALLFGSERVGLSNEDISHCHWLMRIPTREENISMNLGQAVAVCLYELARDEAEDGGSAGAHAKKEFAKAEDVERMTSMLNELLRQSEYPGPAASNERKIRRLLRRMELSPVDVEVWLGVLRQIAWKMESAKGAARD